MLKYNNKKITRNGNSYQLVLPKVWVESLLNTGKESVSIEVISVDELRIKTE